MVVIKLKSLPQGDESLKERVEKAWRININRLSNQNTLIALYKGEILEVYNILNCKKDTEKKDRVVFKLKETQNNFKCNQINYKTRNPCTIIDPSIIMNIQ